MTRTKKSAALLKILVIAAILILLPIVTPNMYIMQIINMIGIYIILGIGINVLTGYTGQLSLGQAAFFGIGAYTAADWAAQYKSLLDLVREKQPDAVIFIQSIFHTTQKKSDSSYFKNEVINERNAAIAQLADGKTIFYLDLNPLFDDENGALRADYSGDGVHVRAPYYVQWRDHLYQFGVVK